MADLEPYVPQKPYEMLGELGSFVVDVTLEQNQEIDVGVGVQLRPAIAAHSNQGDS